MGMNEDGVLRVHFIFIGLIAFLSCPERMDFNLPLAIFAYVLWGRTQFTQKHRIMWLLLLTTLSDLIWILTISVGVWSQQNFSPIRQFTQILAVLNLLYKITLVAYSVYAEESCSDLLQWESFKRKVIYDS